MSEDWRPANASLQLKKQIDAAAPNRATGSDGTIASNAHHVANPTSDHEIDAADGVVKAIDITHDPKHGVDGEKITAAMVRSRDPRIKYLIWNRRIINSQVQPWVWRPYSGANPHDHHFHLSLKREKKFYDNARPWTIGDIKPDPKAKNAEVRPTLRLGSKGEQVSYAQGILSAKVDGDFGPATKKAVELFQQAVGIVADGVVGPQTWGALLKGAAKAPTASGGKMDIPTDAIVDLAINSPVAGYRWRDRGPAPIGYVKGMAIAYANAYRAYKNGDPVIKFIARAQRDDAGDALNHYAEVFKSKGMSNKVAGVDTLRHIFVLLAGLGMRESSGQYGVGRDASASNTSADTAEAGLFQTSWDIRDASPLFPDLYVDYVNQVDDPEKLLQFFRDGVNPSARDLQNYGTGPGASFQRMTKASPMFAIVVAAVGLRVAGGPMGHWGPIRRYEVEVLQIVDSLFQMVQTLVDGADGEVEVAEQPP